MLRCQNECQHIPICNRKSILLKNFRIGKLKEHFISFVETIVGPQGPQGIQGEVGPQGPQGESASVNYKVYSAILNQSGENAPVPIILENTLPGTLTWSYESTGDYFATYSQSFNGRKVLCFIGGASNPGTTYLFKQNDVATIELASWNSINILTNNLITGISIEIRVYN